MTDYEYIYQQVKRFHFSGWSNEELRKCGRSGMGIQTLITNGRNRRGGK